MATYQIIDEPKPRLYSALVVDPVIILFASLLIPVFIELPWLGRFWMPLIWIVVNGFLLGSPTKKKELLMAITAFITLALTFIFLTIIASNDFDFAISVFPYLRIFQQGVLFFSLYLIVFYQSVPYSIHQYLTDKN